MVNHMRLISKEVFVPGRDGRPVFPGFVSYVSATQPRLMHRYGWVDASDTYDDFGDCFSDDNGATWSNPALKLQSRETPEGRVRYAENTCFFDADTGKLLTFCSRGLYPKGHIDVDERFELTGDVLDPVTGQWRGEEVIDMALPGGLAISFCFPIKTKSGKLLVPAMTMVLGEDGKPIHYPGCWAPVHASFTLIGEYISSSVWRGLVPRRRESVAEDGRRGTSPRPTEEEVTTLRWTAGQPVQVDIEKSSRGHCENALVELSDGRLAMIMRGDNSMYPDRLGHKWHCFSEDEGLTWSAPQPLGCTDGGPIESGSNGSALFRSITDGKLYWIGNVALDGERAKANWPRSPLVIAQVQEEPFALRRETITIIDRRQEGEPPLTQMSNFRYYQDRETGDVVIFLSRYGEKDPDDFKVADYYRYRVGMD
jgi:hypothetical protein